MHLTQPEHKKEHSRVFKAFLVFLFLVTPLNIKKIRGGVERREEGWEGKGEGGGYDSGR